MTILDVLLKSMEWEIQNCFERIIARIEPVCESPIEVLFGAAMVFRMQSTFGEGFACCFPADEEDSWSNHQFLLMPQYEWKGYRIDWVLRLRVTYEDGKERDAYVFVECDGHDFHERTKEQAEHDRSKDRVIQASGIPIMRFTGRELYRDVARCVDETMKVGIGRVLGQI